MSSQSTIITGQVRLRRKLCKTLFFIDIQPDNEPKSQVFFRTDDGSLDIVDFQESFRACRPGSIITVQVFPPNDPSEQEGRSHTVWQCSHPVDVVVPYTSRIAFIQDRALGGSSVRRDIVEIKSANRHESTPCKYWINKNKCERGDDCPFQHPTAEVFEKIRVEWLEEREKNRKMATHDPEDPHTSKKPHGLRAIIFVEWIRRTFADQLKNGGAVLDVAGGKGEISMVLSRGFGIPTIVVEPKTRKLPNYWFTRLRRLMLRFEAGHEPDWKSKEVQLALQHWPCDVAPTYQHTMLNDQFLEDHVELLKTVSLFVGLHSDQATIPIVDAALKAGKAFAVVPCCVFSHDNRSRQLRNGELVTTTEQQIQYILEKDTHGHGGQIQTDYLDFEGKNRVVYWIPDK
ncbi:histone H4-like TAF Taf6, SAGA complex subunit [Mucor velutinosus]|uniref:Histone H4-like TAF Taf6, SAGA complex subunit n=1 Tax=Mucor velutinosus TaxID=708070 RepID=A0AAN7DN01_9FUNG|nr:histone H4-like TAF Taf6, SAGA complex subunit [Mucor velutinosus]